MGDVTKIEWADRTFNPWEGCQKVGPGCDNCYAETRNARWNGGEATNWGPGAPRRRTSAANWRKPLQWDREQAAAKAERPNSHTPIPPVFVFCASLADVFDNAVPVPWRRDLFDLIQRTPNLTWLLLTKRPGNVIAMAKALAEEDLGRYADDLGVRSWWPRNAALGCTVVNQEEADRDVPKLLDAKARLNPAFAFLSMEPLLGPVDLRQITLRRDGQLPSALSNRMGDYILPLRGALRDSPVLDWLIVGGESGPNARPMDLAWPRDLLQQTEGTGVVFNFKQVGGKGANKGGHELDGQTYFGRPSI